MLSSKIAEISKQKCEYKIRLISYLIVQSQVAKTQFHYALKPLLGIQYDEPFC